MKTLRIKSNTLLLKEINNIAKTITYEDLQKTDLFVPHTLLKQELDTNKYKEINFDNSGISPKGAILAANIIACSNVTKVMMPNNNLREDAILVAKYLSSPGSKVKYVDFSNNSLEQHGVQVARYVCAQDSSIEELIICFNKLKSYSLDVVRIVTNGSKIKKLDIAFNFISPKSIYGSNILESIAESLIKPSSVIKCIDLSYNSFHELDVKKIESEYNNKKTNLLLQELSQCDILPENLIGLINEYATETIILDIAKNEDSS